MREKTVLRNPFKMLWFTSSSFKPFAGVLAMTFILSSALSGCSSSRKAQSQNESAIQDSTSIETVLGSTAGISTSESSAIKLTYRNERGNIELNLNPFDTEMVVLISGIKPLPNATSEVSVKDSSATAGKNEPAGGSGSPSASRPPNVSSAQAGSQNVTTPSRPVENEFQRSLRLLLEAQSFFYQENYTMAIERLDASLALQEAADSYALKALSHFMLDQYDETREAWAKAMAINPDLDSPNIARFRDVISGNEPDNN